MNNMRTSTDSSLSQTYGFQQSTYNPYTTVQQQKPNPSTPPYAGMPPVNASPPIGRNSSSSSNGYSPMNGTHSPSRDYVDDGHFFQGIGQTEHVQPRKAFMGAIATMNTTEQERFREREKKEQYKRELAAQVEEDRKRKQREQEMRKQQELAEENKMRQVQQQPEQARRTDPNAQRAKTDDAQLRYELEKQIEEKNRRIAEEKRKERERERLEEERIRKARETEDEEFRPKPALSRTNSTRASLEVTRNSSEGSISAPVEPPQPKEPEPEPPRVASTPQVQVMQPTITPIAQPYPIIMPFAPQPSVSSESIAAMTMLVEQMKQLMRDKEKEKDNTEQQMRQKEKDEQFQLLMSKLQQTENELAEMKRKFEAQEKEKAVQEALKQQQQEQQRQQEQRKRQEWTKPTQPTWSALEPPVSRRMNRSRSAADLEDDTMKSLKAESTFIYVKKKAPEPKQPQHPQREERARSAIREPEVLKPSLTPREQLSAPPTAKRPEHEQPTRDWGALFANKGTKSPRDPEKLFKKTDQRLKMLEDIEKKLSHSNKNDTLSDLLSQFVDNGRMRPLTSASNPTTTRPGTTALPVPLSARQSSHNDSFGSPEVDKSLISESSFIPLKG